MSAITIDGDLVHYEKLGRGRPVILLHGWIGSWRYWIPTMQQLHLKYSVYTLDFIGFGDSAKNPTKYAIEKQARMLNEFMEQLGIPKAAMIGHGLGAMVLTRFANLYPEKMARAMLVSLPLFDPGDLKDRTPAGTRTLLTGQRDRFSLAPNIAAIEEQYKEKTIPRSPLANLELQRSQLTANKVESPASPPDKPSTPETPPPPVSATSTTEAVAAKDEPPKPAEETIANRPATPKPVNPYATMSESLPTIATISPEERQRLLAAAAKSNIFSSAVNNEANLLLEAMTGKTLLSLLERCFKRSDTSFDKLRADVEKTDEKVLLASAQGYNAVRFLDDLRKITAPVVAVHGADDPVLPQPTEDVWQYLTVDKDDVFVPIPLSTVRHFPMLEHEPFTRLAIDFLDTPEISKLEVRDRWRRRSR